MQSGDNRIDIGQFQVAKEKCIIFAKIAFKFGRVNNIDLFAIFKSNATPRINLVLEAECRILLIDNR